MSVTFDLLAAVLIMDPYTYLKQFLEETLAKKNSFLCVSFLIPPVCTNYVITSVNVL